MSGRGEMVSCVPQLRAPLGRFFSLGLETAERSLILLEMHAVAVPWSRWCRLPVRGRLIAAPNQILPGAKVWREWRLALVRCPFHCPSRRG